MFNKKVLVISSELPPLPGGIGNHAYFLSDYLQKSNFDVSILSDYRSELLDLEFDKKQDFKIYRVKRNFFTQINRVRKSFFLAKKNEVIICSGKFSLWIGAVLKLFFWNKKFIAVLHGSEIGIGGDFIKKITSLSLEKYDEIIAVSSYTKQVALKSNTKLKIDVINNGFNLQKSSAVESFEKLTGFPKIVTVGNVTYRKGQQNVINSLPLLKESFPTIHYHCIGIPTEKEAFLELAKKINVHNNVTFHGALKNEELVAILNISDVFFMLSDVIKNGDVEGFGIAILEANSLGLPAIGSNNSGIVDAINHGFSGELVNPKNYEKVAEAFFKIMNNYNKYSHNAIQWSTNFTWDKIGEKYIEIINR